jgi:hypothetical protein
MRSIRQFLSLGVLATAVNACERPTGPTTVPAVAAAGHRFDGVPLLLLSFVHPANRFSCSYWLLRPDPNCKEKRLAG